MPLKYALDTNVFIGAVRDDSERVRVLDFHSQYVATEYLSAVVAMELRAGARTPQAATVLERQILARFEIRDRVFAPSYSAFLAAGRVLAALRDHGTSLRGDALIAASCREAGITLVTKNARDFTRIRKVMPFQFTVWS
jgi:predicted nucleic acid-binding protein